jgi:hypothetical protein
MHRTVYNALCGKRTEPIPLRHLIARLLQKLEGCVPVRQCATTSNTRWWHAQRFLILKWQSGTQNVPIFFNFGANVFGTKIFNFRTLFFTLKCSKLDSKFWLKLSLYIEKKGVVPP